MCFLRFLLIAYQGGVIKQVISVHFNTFTYVTGSEVKQIMKKSQKRTNVWRFSVELRVQAAKVH